jgi:MoaA/NifB/PqqE/SkfB family radical SAM enzyme
MHPRALARLARIHAPGWIRRPAAPVRAVVALTRRCNQRCAYCRSSELPPGEEMTPDEVGRLCRSMPDLTWLDLTGGEPMVRRDVVEVFDRVLDATPNLAVLHFPTNGSFPDRAVACARRIRQRRPEVATIVTVSVDGPPALDEALRGRSGAFAAAVDTYRALRRIQGIETYIGTTVGASNRDALEALRDALERELPGFDDRSWHWNLRQHSDHFFANRGLTDGDDAVEDAALVRRQLRRRWPPHTAVETMELVFLVNLLTHVEGGRVGLPCPALHSTCFVAADARLYPCHVFDRPLADLRTVDMDVGAVWSSPEVRAARRAVERLECGGCFTPCEAYPMVVGSPLRSALYTLGRLAVHSRSPR